MNTKKLYVLISNGGDGSYYPCYTFNNNLIAALSKASDEDRMTYENGIGCDGDGFHYEVLNVPESCTAESLGITMLADNYADQFAEEG